MPNSKTEKESRKKLFKAIYGSQPASSRVFNGKKFRLVNRATVKPEADNIKKIRQANGERVRVVRYQKMFLIYAR